MNLNMENKLALEEISDADWLGIIETNFLSGVRLARHYLPRMKARNWGRILFLARNGLQRLTRWPRWSHSSPARCLPPQTAPRCGSRVA
jgi:NAD(P)-dependent dehydrogenase (short-subunit alcohol dehydrogenase family)